MHPKPPISPIEPVWADGNPAPSSSPPVTPPTPTLRSATSPPASPHLPQAPTPRAGARRWAWAVLLGLLILGLVVAAALAWHLHRAQPSWSGNFALPPSSGLAGPVRIERDANAVPTIHAETLNDLMFGLGWAHAQDRLWQMEVHRRIGAGRLSEAFGSATLDNDRFLRALGIRRAAERQWEQLAPQSQQLLEAYAAGVNASVAQLRALPPEFVLTGVQPEPWHPIDSLSWTLMMAWDLGGNWTTELMRLRLSAVLDVQRIQELLPPTPGQRLPKLRDYSQTYRELGLHGPTDGASAEASPSRLWEALSDAAPLSGVEGTGSNNWVLSGDRTTTRKPLLANDPHLGLSAPALWYMARLQSPQLRAAGATLPGVPLVVLGQNAHLAWGFTNTGPDVQDLYIEAIDGQDAKRYRTPNGSLPFEIHEERIRVKGGADVQMTVRSTRHGPVISDAGTLKDLTPALERQGYVLALRWSALEPDMDMVGAGLGLVMADSVESFLRASQRWYAPMQNMVVADQAGRIAMVAAGRVPMRRPDNDLMGTAPALGWESRYDWVGWVPFDETPRTIDPPSGAIATANQRIHGDDYPHFLGTDWALPYRQQRIEQLLSAKPRHSLDDLIAVQQDEKSLAAQVLLPWLQRAQSNHPAAAAAKAHLDTFDGTMHADATAPLLYWAWHRALSRRLLEPHLGSERYERLVSQRSLQDALEGILRRQDAFWCDAPQTPERESCDTRVSQAWTDALETLAGRFGPDVSRWRWDAAHVAVAEHKPFSKVPGLRGQAELQRPIGGDTFTIHAQRVGLGGPIDQRFRSTHGPSLKAVYDLKDPLRSRFIHSSGQSGLFWSPHYRDFLDRWATGNGIPVWVAPSEAAALGSLTLTPTP